MSWLDRFFASYYRHRPVNATFIGQHDHDHVLPDLSVEGTQERIADMRALLGELEAREGPGDPGAPSGTPESIDHRLAASFLRIQLWEAGAPHFEAGNPSHATGEATFGALSLMLTDFAPAFDRAGAIASRLRAVKPMLRSCRDRVQSAPAAWTSRAVRECRGAIHLFGQGIEAWADEHGIDGPVRSELTSAGLDAAGAIARYGRHLEQLPAKPDDLVAAGSDALDLLIREGHCLARPADDIAAYARAEGEAARTAEREAAAELGYDSPAAAKAALAQVHPTSDDYLGRYRETWEAMRDLAGQHDLVSWPEFPIRYIERPHWVRAAAPHLYFLFYRSPAAFHRPAVHDYLVAPLPDRTDPDAVDAFLRANHDGVIKLNHVIHHGGIGHHVQNWNAFRAPSRIGRMAAVDCAARIAMFCGGTMAEGWACYATDLMAEVGALTPLERVAELGGRARMCARAVVDVELHTGRMTLDEATSYYREHAAMPQSAARSEAVKNSMFPGAALMYLMGTDGVHDLRAQTADREGSTFSLRDFHDRFLTHGSIPVALIADLMLRPNQDVPDHAQ